MFRRIELIEHIEYQHPKEVLDYKHGLCGIGGTDAVADAWLAIKAPKHLQKNCRFYFTTPM